MLIRSAQSCVFIATIVQVLFFKGYNSFKSFRQGISGPVDKSCNLFRRFIAKDKNKEPSVDYSSLFSKWYLNIFETLTGFENLEIIPVSDDYSNIKGFIKKDVPIDFKCESFKSDHFKYVRKVSFTGGGYSVLNFVIFPDTNYDIPIFGVDIVILPGSSLANIDFQPLDTTNEYFESDLYSPYKSRLKKWSLTLPAGGDFPVNAEKYFSPLVLWTKFPSEKNTALLYLIGEALKDYLNSYLDLVRKSKTTTSNEKKSRELFMKDYLTYRIENDPAKRLLTAAFGKNWTEYAIENIMFPMSHTLGL
jgi:phycoerythrobilin:ferredoxin oxidoreductase